MPNPFKKLHTANHTFFITLSTGRGVSSVGSERMLDRHEVTGSIPVHPTKGAFTNKKVMRLF